MLRWSDVNDSGNDHILGIDDVVINATTASATPSINVTPSSAAFGTVTNSTFSSSTTFSISGTNLTGAPGNLTISAPNTDFQVSSDNVSFGASANIAFSSATLSSTNFYVRFSPQSSGAKSGNLGFSGGGLTTTPTISLSGTGTASASLSDIIVATGFTEPENIAYASNQAADATDANSVEVAKFTLRDGGSGLNDADALSTTLTAISFTVTNHANLRRVALYDGTTELAEVAAAATVNFSSLTFAASDNGSKDFSIRVTFAASVTDRQQFSFTVSSVTADGAGSLFAAANGGAAASSTTGDRNKIQVTATALAFVQQPSNVGPGNNMSPAVTVSANDALGNRDTDFTGNVAITSTGTLTGSPVIQAAVSGLATFSSLAHSATGSGLTLTARRNPENDRDVTSNTFNVVQVPTAGEIVINQISPDYNGASDEYVEIVNLTNKTFDLSLLKLVYQSSSGSTGGAGGTLSGTLLPYSFWLLSPNATITVGQTSGLARDGSITAGFAGTNGQIGIQLVSDNTTIDAVGYGTLTGGFREGTAAGNPSTDGGLKRTTDGADTNDNSADFSTVANGNIKLRNSNSRIAIASANLPTGSYANVVVTGNHTLNAAVSVTNQLELVAGTLTTGGNLTLKSTTNGTATVVGGTNSSISGNVTVERFLPWQSANNNGFRFVGHPFSAAPVINTVTGLPTASNTLIGYNETGTGAYVEIANRAGTWPLATSYGVWTNSTNTLSMSGALQLSDLNSVSFANNGTGWNLAANPFYSVLDWDAVTRSNVQNANWIWVKDNVTQGSGTWGSYIDGVSANGGSRYLAPAQGFMIKANGASPNVSFPAAARVTGQTPTFQRTALIGEMVRVRVKRPTNSSSMETVIRFRNGATNGFDSDYDAQFMSDWVTATPDIFTKDLNNVSYSINAMPELNGQSQTIPLQLALEADMYTLVIDKTDVNPGTTVTIEDTKTGNFYEMLSNQDSVNFSYSAADLADRFKVHFNRSTVSTGNISSDDNIKIGTDGSKIALYGAPDASVKILDLAGKVLRQYSQLDTNQEAIETGLPTGVYLIQISSGKKIKNIKFIIR
jgi:hypothetical protein